MLYNLYNKNTKTEEEDNNNTLLIRTNYSLYDIIQMNKIPTILQPWVHLYRSTPKLYLPYTKIDIFFSLLCAIAFSTLRITFRHVLYYFGWPVGGEDTYFAAACMTSFWHSTLILPGLASLLLSQPFVPSGKLETSPQWYQDATHSILSYCTGYMIYDSILGYVIETWQPGIGPVLTTDDWTFVGHHILTSLYMLSCRLISAGHVSAMILMFNGEFSAPIMNMHFFLEKALEQECCKGIECLPSLFAYNEQVFSIVYLVCRVMVSPFVISYVSYDLLFKRGREKRDVPLWLAISWMPMCWGVQFGSIPWIMTCMEKVKASSSMVGNGGEL